MAQEEHYRRLSLVTDREEKCVVHPQFNHFCSKHRQPTCATKKPPHCAWKGKLALIACDLNIHIDGPPKKFYKLCNGKQYCEECIGQFEKATDVFDKHGFRIIGAIRLPKMTPAEIQKLREKDAEKQ